VSDLRFVVAAFRLAQLSHIFRQIRCIGLREKFTKDRA